MSAPKPRVGIIGCGRISEAYLKNAPQLGMFDVVALADLNLDCAKARAEEFGVSRVLTNEQLLADPEVEYVLNLTTPQAHVAVARSVLEAGKSVYNEKPLAASREEAGPLLELARSKGLRIGCAPDTFLGAGLQAARRAIDAGKIGQPIAAEVLFSLYPGPKTFDAFFWKRGGGILMDMGPYYLTALVAMLGPVKRVMGVTRTQPAPQLTAADPDWRAKVEVPTHVAGVLDFASGVACDFRVSYEVCGYYDIHFRVQGTEGTLHCPDPNKFSGPVLITAFGKEKETIPANEGLLADQARGIGLGDMAQAAREGRPHRASGDLAYHVLDIMQGLVESSAQGRAIEMQTAPPRPEPLMM